MITLLVAMDENHLIGDGNRLPWHLPGELKLFRKRTLGGAVIMGRKTFESLPCYKKDKPVLDGRANFVVTRNAAELSKTHPAVDSEGPFFVESIEAALEVAREKCPEFSREFFIIGGRQIYALALESKLIDRMFITHVKGEHAGDVYFPELGDEWIGRPDIETKTYDVYEYVRRPDFQG